MENFCVFNVSSFGSIWNLYPARYLLSHKYLFRSPCFLFRCRQFDRQTIYFIIMLCCNILAPFTSLRLILTILCKLLWENSGRFSFDRTTAIWWRHKGKISFNFNISYLIFLILENSWKIPWKITERKEIFLSSGKVFGKSNYTIYYTVLFPRKIYLLFSTFTFFFLFSSLLPPHHVQ